MQTLLENTIFNNSIWFNQSYCVLTNVKGQKLRLFTDDYSMTDWADYRYNIPMEIYHEIFKFLWKIDIGSAQLTSKDWHDFYKNFFSSYKYFLDINSQDYTESEFENLLIFLKHISILNEIIKRDFGNHSENLIKPNELQIQLSKDLNLKTKFYSWKF